MGLIGIRGVKGKLGCFRVANELEVESCEWLAVRILSQKGS